MILYCPSFLSGAGLATCTRDTLRLLKQCGNALKLSTVFRLKRWSYSAQDVWNINHLQLLELLIRFYPLSLPSTTSRIQTGQNENFLFMAVTRLECILSAASERFYRRCAATASSCWTRLVSTGYWVLIQVLQSFQKPKQDFGCLPKSDAFVSNAPMRVHRETSIRS